MDCRRFVDELVRRGALEPLPADLRVHAETCRACALELKSRRLLGLGSHVSAMEPRAGFGERVRARLGADRRPTGWYDAIGLVARPAFGLAAAVAVLTVAVYSVVPGSTGPADLALMAERDPIGGLLSGNAIELLAPAEQSPR